MREYFADALGVLDRREQAHAAATARAGEHVEVEAAPHQVGPLPLQLQQASSVAGELEAILGDGRPQQVAAELFESRALCRRHAQVGMEIDAFEVRLAGPTRADPRGIRLVPGSWSAGWRSRRKERRLRLKRLRQWLDFDACSVRGPDANKAGRVAIRIEEFKLVIITVKCV